MPTPQNSQACQLLQSLRLSLSLTANLCTFLHFSPQTEHSTSHCLKHTQNHRISHPHAHNGQTRNNVEPLSYFKSLCLAPSPTTNSHKCSPIPLPALLSPSHCPNHNQKQRTKHPPAHNSHITKVIKHFRDFAPHHLLLPLAAKTHAN